MALRDVTRCLCATRSAATVDDVRGAPGEMIDLTFGDFAMFEEGRAIGFHGIGVSPFGLADSATGEILEP